MKDIQQVKYQLMHSGKHIK